MYFEQCHIDFKDGLASKYISDLISVKSKSNQA